MWRQKSVGEEKTGSKGGGEEGGEGGGREVLSKQKHTVLTK